MNDDKTLHKMVVLFADVCGSTRIYEKWGDDVARADIALCLDELTAVAERHRGRLLKTIGDEVMCAFPAPQQAYAAATGMHERLRELGARDRFRTGALTVKIGFHYGIGEWRGEELVGALPAVAQQVIGKARTEEILVSGAALDALPDFDRANAQLMDDVESAADAERVAIYKLAWEVSDDATTFRVATTAAPSINRCLVLRYQGQEFCVDAAHSHCRIGRGADNDIVIGSRVTSRQHAEIVFRHGRFYLRDSSINGTAVLRQGAPAVQLRREEGLVAGDGVLLFGDKNARDSATAVTYHGA